jgi:hypothetical protein
VDPKEKMGEYLLRMGSTRSALVGLAVEGLPQVKAHHERELARHQEAERQQMLQAQAREKRQSDLKAFLRRAQDRRLFGDDVAALGLGFTMAPRLMGVNWAPVRPMMSPAVRGAFLAIVEGVPITGVLATIGMMDVSAARNEIALAEYGWRTGRRDLLPDVVWSNQTAYAKFEQRMGYPFGKPIQPVAPTHPVSTPLEVALGRPSVMSPPVSMQQTQPTRVSSNGTVAPVDTPRVLAAEAPRTEVPQAAPTDFVTPVHRYEPVSSGYAELPTYGVDITSERVFFTEINNRLTVLTLIPECMRGDAWEAGVVELLKALEAVGFRKKVTTGATPPDPDDERRKKIGELLLLSAELIVDPKMRETAGKLAEELAVEAGLNREQAKKLRVLVEVLVPGVGKAPKDPKAPKPEWKSPEKLAESKAVQRYVEHVEGVPAERVREALEAMNARNLPGIALLSKGLTNPEVILRGTHNSVGVIPLEVAQKMVGKKYASFNAFRKDFWMNMADSSYAKEFSPGNIAFMKKGLAPDVDPSQWLGQRKSFELHHRTPIHVGGAVYDLSNILIVTPRYHQEILSKGAHYGKK